MVLHLAEQLDVPLRETQPAAAGRGLRAGLLAAAADATELGADQARARPAARRPRAVPGGRRRPRAGTLVAANARVAMLLEGVGAAPARTAGQRAPARAAPRGHGAADRATSASGARTCCATSRPRSTQTRRRRAATRSTTSCARYPGPEAEPRATHEVFVPLRRSTALHVPEHPHDVRHRARRHRLRSWRSRPSSPPTRRDAQRGCRGDARGRRAGRPSSGGTAPASASTSASGRGSSPYQRRCASTRTCTSPASRSTRRCLETPGWT